MELSRVGGFALTKHELDVYDRKLALGSLHQSTAVLHQMKSFRFEYIVQFNQISNQFSYVHHLFIILDSNHYHHDKLSRV